MKLETIRLDRSLIKDPEDWAFLSKVFQSVFITTFLDALSVYTLLPLIPDLFNYYADYDRGKLYWALHSVAFYLRDQVSASDVPYLNAVLFGGLLISLCSFLKFLSIPVIKVLSGFYGRKHLMIVSLIGLAISYLLWVLSKTFTIFCISRLLAGLCKGNSQLGTYMISDIASSKARYGALLTLDLAAITALILGPLLSGLSVLWFQNYTHYFFVPPAFFAMCITLLNIFYCVFYLPETLPENQRIMRVDRNKKKTMGLINPLGLFQFRLATRLDVNEFTTMQFFCTIHFFYTVLVSGFEFSLPFLTLHRFSTQPLNQALIFSFIGAITSIVHFTLIRKIREGTEYSIVVSGTVGVLVSMFIIAFAKTLFDLHLGLLIYSIGAAAVRPAFYSLIINYTTDSKYHIQNIFQSQKALAEAIGPLVVAIIFWHVGGQATCVLIGVALIAPMLFLITQKNSGFISNKKAV